MTALLTIDDLSVSFWYGRTEVPVLHDVTLEVRRGEALGLAGESGSGKSTVAHALMRLLPTSAAVTGGDIRFEECSVLGYDAATLRRYRWARVSLVSQAAMNSLNPMMRVAAHFVDTLRAHGISARQEIGDRAEAMLDLVGVPRSRLSSYPHQLSGGMRQRVVIALALLLNPDLVVLDEPTTALDVVVQREIIANLVDLRANLDFSLLFITHDLPLLATVADRIAVMYAGRVVEEAPTRDLLAHPTHPYTQALLASAPSARRRRQPLTSIPGSPPDPRRLPGGCAFHPRCTEAVPSCAADLPELIPVGDGHTAACLLVESVAAR